MKQKIFALITEGDIFEIFVISPNWPIAEQFYAGLSSSPKFVECTGLEIKSGFLWDGNSFFHFSDIEKNNPIIFDKNILNNTEVATFACIAENEVFGTVTYTSDLQNFEMACAGFRSDPICIEIPNDSNADIGWTWDGQQFIPAI
jgi:hypothetical protein